MYVCVALGFHEKHNGGKVNPYIQPGLMGGPGHATEWEAYNMNETIKLEKDTGCIIQMNM